MTARVATCELSVASTAKIRERDRTAQAHWCTSGGKTPEPMKHIRNRETPIFPSECPPLHGMTVTQMERRRSQTQFRERATARSTLVECAGAAVSAIVGWMLASAVLVPWCSARRERRPRPRSRAGRDAVARRLLSRRLTFQGKGRKCIVTFYEGGISTRLSSIFFNCKMQIKTKCCHAKCDISVRERVNESAGGRISNFPFVQIMSAERAARRIGASGGVLRAACSVQGQRGDSCPATSYLVSPPPRRRTGWRRPRRVAHSCRGSSTCEATLTRRPHSAQANGIRFLTAEIPPRTFTPRPTEINRSFNTNSTPLWPHWQTDGYFRFSFFRLLLVFARCRCRENKKCLALPLT